MACTPRKLVHWSADNEVNEFVYGSPYSDASSDSVNATSTLQYINSQLIAHGFAKGGGISVEGLSKDDTENLSKCLLGMLSQRMEDMSRAEDLSTKLRTMSYEHERLMNMHRTTEEQLASSERETNLYKSRLAAANKSTQAAEAAYKASTADLQRTRTSLQSVRQTHAAELKRREKETEKLLERWQKISDAQTKLGASASGLMFKSTHANPLADSRDGDAVGPRGSDLLEDALEEAQSARKELIEENTSLKNVVLSAANEINRMARSIRMKVDASPEGSAQQKLTFSDLFSIPAPESASDKFAELLASFHDAINQIGNEVDADQVPISTQIPSPSNIHKPKDENKEIQRLQNIIVDLRRQLEQAQTQRQTSAYSDQAQDIIRKFVNDDNEKSHVQERRVLEKIRKELDHARKKVDEAALTLRDEKEMLEEERQAFSREQHLWRSRMGIPNDGDEPKPASGLAAYFDVPAEPLDIPAALASPRSVRKPKRAKSPSKPPLGASPRKAVSKSKVRVAGKKGVNAAGTTPKKGKAIGRAPALGASPARARVIPPMETEVFASPPPNLLPQLGGGTSAASQSRIVTDTFVLPPPTPLTSIPPEADILASLGQGRSLAPDFSAAPLPPLGGGVSSMEEMGDANTDENVAGPSMKASMSLGKKPFPVAKPFAQRMIHAYSPARPSPLSRILNLAKSPSVASESDVDLDDDVNDGRGYVESRIDGEGQEETIHAGPPAMTLDELGIVDGGGDRHHADNYEEEDSGPIEESPLREKNMRVANRRKPPVMNAAARRGATTAAVATKEKLRGARAEREKENGGGTMALRTGRTKSGKVATGTAPATKPAVTGGGTSKGGARRVPIGSVDAAPIGRNGWK